MSNITYCVEYFHAKPKHRDELLKALTALIAHSRQEADCLQYDLLQDNKDSNLFIIIMKFGTPAGIKKHEQQPYVQQFIQHDMERLCESVAWNDASLVRD